MPVLLDRTDDENRTVQKKVRFTPAEAQELEEFAETIGSTQSEVLREGLKALLRVKRRRENIGLLIDLTEGEEPTKVAPVWKA